MDGYLGWSKRDERILIGIAIVAISAIAVVVWEAACYVARHLSIAWTWN